MALYVLLHRTDDAMFSLEVVCVSTDMGSLSGRISLVGLRDSFQSGLKINTSTILHGRFCFIQFGP